MSQNQDRAPRFTRRDFSLGGFAAGIGLLTASTLVWARQQADPSSQEAVATPDHAPGANQPPRFEPPDPNDALSLLRLHITVEPHDDHVALHVSLSNQGSEPIRLPRDPGEPVDVFVQIDDARYPLRVIDYLVYDWAMMSRALPPTHIVIRPNAKPVLLRAYAVPWSEDVLNHPQLAGRPALLGASFTINLAPHDELPQPERAHTLSTTPEALVLPRQFKAYKGSEP